jgi:DNA-binding NtrC family response regulator
MDPGLQAKLLRAIEAREILRVGGMKPVAIDVRFIAASHRDLFTSEDFRRDLYYRLAGVTLEIPPLRERRAPASARSPSSSSPVARLSAEATALLARHDWPGNVRELRNVLDRALLLAQGRDDRRRAHSSSISRSPSRPPRRPTATSARASSPRSRPAPATRTRAARRLGMSRATLVRKLRRPRDPATPRR